MAEPPSRGGWIGSHLELVATVVISLSAILTAWSAFQASQWNTEVSQANIRANSARLESTRYEILSGQDRGVDVAVFTTFLSAFNTDLRDGLVDLIPGVAYEPTPGTLSGFIYNRVRPEFKPAFDAWLVAYTTDRDNAPPTPFAMTEYQLANAAEARRLLEEVSSHQAAASHANENATNYLLTVLGFALVIFLGSLSTKLDRQLSTWIALGFATLLFLTGVAIVIAQPRVAVI